MFHGIGPEARDTSSKNRKFGPPWLGGRLLRCRRLRRFRNCVGLSLDWQLVTLTRFSLSSKKQKKETLMNPWFLVYISTQLTLLVHPDRGNQEIYFCL